MNREECVNKVCGIVVMAYSSVGDYSHASDCFCCDSAHRPAWAFQNQGRAIAYVEQAVREKLERDGFAVKEPPTKEK